MLGWFCIIQTTLTKWGRLVGPISKKLTSGADLFICIGERDRPHRYHYKDPRLKISETSECAHRYCNLQ